MEISPIGTIDPTAGIYTTTMYAAMAPAYTDTILHILLDNDIDGSGLNKQNKYGMTALHLMIKSGSTQRLKLMLMHKSRGFFVSGGEHLAVLSPTRHRSQEDEATKHED